MSHFVFPTLFHRVSQYMEDGGMRLRPLSFFDGRLIKSGLRADYSLRSGGLTGLISKSPVSLWWWLKKTYVISYCIEVGSECKGFIGLYNMSPDRSAEISLVIFDNRDRRLGYGTRAFNLLAQNLKRCPQEIRVRVRADNHSAISFWSGLGFKGIGDLDDTKVMSMELKGCRGGA